MRIVFMCPPWCLVQYAAEPRRRHNRGVRYQFVDCRWELSDPGRGRELYLAGHIPGASFLDVDEDLSDLSVEGSGRHPLPSADRFAETAARAGIGEDALVVAYGNGGGPERLWWLLRHFGHDACAVLAGGIDAWLGPLRDDDEEITPARFEPRPRDDDTMSAEEIADRLGDDSLVVVDARIESRWRGDPNPIDKIPGRIPGSLNLPFTDDDPIPEEVLAAPEIVVYCGSGVTSCVPLLRLARAGRPDAKLYAGSWSEWEGRDLPRESG
jgi:thiosulfate/3-mercaptopyruvate sulfurtransferase